MTVPCIQRPKSLAQTHDVTARMGKPRLPRWVK